MENESGKADVARQVETDREELKALRREVTRLQNRLDRLEVSEKLVEAPDSAGDAAVRR